jgi:hypothetical protein
MLNKSVEFGFCTFFFVSSSGKSDTDSAGDVSDTIAPDELVEFSVNSDIVGSHCFLSESNDFSDGTGSLLLE